MRLIKTLTLLVPLLALTACAGLTPSIKVVPVARPVLVQPDSVLLKLCSSPVKLVEGPLTQAQAEKLWATDRAHLVACKRLKAELQKFYQDRDAALVAKP